MGPVDSITIGFAVHQLCETYAIVLRPHFSKPSVHVSTKHQRIRHPDAARCLIPDEVHKRDGGDVNLLHRHLAELRDRNLYGILKPIEVGTMRGLMPLKEASIVDEIL